TLDLKRKRIKNVKKFDTTNSNKRRLIMENANKREQYFNSTGMEGCIPDTVLCSKPAVLNTLRQSEQKVASDSYTLLDTDEFCGWGYPMHLGNY
ncbi:MAG: hypothetical protein WCP20_23650, partial [Desulfuromonadales bacterium]